MGFIRQLGEQILGETAQAGMGLLLGGINDKRQLRQQGRLQEQQIAGQKQMTDYNMEKQMEMWRNTSYPAQIEQMKKAGVNPALMYGIGGGGGGSTNVATGNVQGGEAPKGGGEALGAMGIQAQYALLNAQKENIEADTANKKADAANKPIQGKNIEADTALKQINWNLAAIEEDIRGATSNAAKAMIMQELESSFEQLKILKNEGKISGATVEDKVKTIKAEAIGALLENILTKAKTRGTDAQTRKTGEETRNIKEIGTRVERAQINKWAQEIAQGWNMVGTAQKGAETNFQREIVDEFGQQTWEVVEKAVQAIMLKNILGGNQRSPIGGFHKR